MRYLPVFLFLFLRSDAAKCPLPGKRRWLTDLNGVYTSLLDETTTETGLIPRSVCLPMFKSTECTISRKKQVCISEIKYRNGYRGDFRLSESDNQKCYIKVQLQIVKPRSSLIHTSIINNSRLINEHRNLKSKVKISKRKYSNYCEVEQPEKHSLSCDYAELKDVLANCVNTCLKAEDARVCIEKCTIDDRRLKAECEGTSSELIFDNLIRNVCIFSFNSLTQL